MGTEPVGTDHGTPRKIRRVRVLIVDDQADFRKLMRRRLESDGRFEVVGEAANGREAVELAEKHQPDTAIVDLEMPVMDGLDAIRAMRDRVPNVKSVVLSAYGADVASEAANKMGAYAYLEKGTAIDQILTVLAPLAPPEFED